MRKGVTNDPDAIRDVCGRADVLWLALCDDEGPYCVPVNFVLVGQTLYLHSGRKGRKARILTSGRPLAFSMAVDLKLRTGDTACKYGYRFRSVMGRGIPRIAEGDERRTGLDALVRKYAGEVLPCDERVLEITEVFAVDMDATSVRTKE